MNERLNPSMTGTRYHALKQLHRGILYAVKTHFSKTHKLETLLDYGCGAKPYESIFPPYFNRYLGADIAENNTADILIKENGNIKIENEAIDVILSTQVLEHVTDVDAYLSEAHRVLKKDGVLLLSTHGYWMFHPNPTDLWRWTKDGLERTVVKNGFVITETLGLMNLAASGLQLFQDGIQWKIPRLLRPVLSLIILLGQKIVDNGSLHHQDASIYLVIARKIDK
jgi:SAM-dependent methyltransferase